MNIVVFLLIYIIAGPPIFAIVLLVGCAAYNDIVGGDELRRGVPDPPFRRAIVISFLTLLVNLLVGFIAVLLALGLLWAIRSTIPQWTAFAEWSLIVLRVIVEVAVTTQMLSYLLPTRLLRALFLTLICEAIALIAAFVGYAWLHVLHVKVW
jgi:hypothetical protein